MSAAKARPAAPVTRLDWALALARAGFLVFPLPAGEKRPAAGESWTERMTSDESAIKDWFEQYPGMNYGVCGGDRFAVIDLDRKASADGVSAFGDLELANGEFETFRVRSPSGGVHLYLAVSEPASNAHSFPAGVDVRGRRGYVVGPGCEVGGRAYEAEGEVGDIADAPDWIASRLRAPRDRDPRRDAPLCKLDLPESVAAATAWLSRRAPAVEGEGGDAWTYETACGARDFGLSEAACLELMAEHWNERCEPPWNVDGSNSLEEKVRNAYRYAEDPAGKRAPKSAEELWGGVENVVEFADPRAQTESKPPLRSRLDAITHRGGAIFRRGRRREYVAPAWLPAHGLVALLAKRSGGKSTVMLDLALRLAAGMDWQGWPLAEGWAAVYACGEDDEGAEENIRAWCRRHGVDAPPPDFIFLDGAPDLLSADDAREWAEHARRVVGDRRAVLFLDTWQRATARGGQNKDEDMQRAVHHAEALATALRGPCVAAFHPPKHDDRVVTGSAVIENSTTAIWRLSEEGIGRRLEVTRIKGKGVGNYRLFRLEEVGLGERDDFGRERSGVVATLLGGVAADAARDEHREAVAHAVRAVVEAERAKEPAERRYPLSLEALARELADTAHGDLRFPKLRATKDQLRQTLGGRPFAFADGTELRLSNSAGRWQVTHEASRRSAVSADFGSAGTADG
ncbi:MAG: bifunctional DNA primase/polymerase [Maricaulaceae bacterium]|jgi:hypothetical protein